MNLLASPVHTVTVRQQHVHVSLLELLALLGHDRIEDFPTLRAHQAPAWHAFLVQLGAIVGLAQSSLPMDADGWRAALRSLTNDWPDDEPWRLVTPPDRPAFLQPPAPGGLSGFTGVAATPDSLDVLVTSKNHDLKAERLTTATPEHWLLALLTLQTLEGVMGAGKYGIVRMNGGYGSRPFMGVVPAGGPGARWRRDVEVLIADGGRALRKDSAFAGETALLWLLPWDGATGIGLDELHPLVIEVCRRVRLEIDADGRILARTAQSKAARISGKDLRGLTGDPWAPVELGKDTKLLTIGAGGFGWRRMKELLFAGKGDRTFQRPRLAWPREQDRGPVEIEVAALARGQGKTEGFHTRRIQIPPHLNARAEVDQQRLTRLANQMELDATSVASRLKGVLFALFQRGADKPKFDRRDTDAQVQPFLRRFDHRIDTAFFPTLFGGATDDAAADTAGEHWQHALRGFALDAFEAAADAAPRTEARRILHRASCERRLRGALNAVLPATRPPLPQPATEPPDAE